MCKETDAIISNIDALGDHLIQLLRQNSELKEYNVLATLSIEGVKDIIYATDVETNTVLFMNGRSQELFGDGLGKKML